MNKALLDTDTLSELGKAVDLNVARNGADYLALHGRYTLTVISVKPGVEDEPADA